jgi:hypothetical protein
LPPTPRHGPRKNATRLFPVVQGESVFVDKIGMGSHLLELLPKCDILMAARDCQGSWLGIPSTMLALVDEVIE